MILETTAGPYCTSCNAFIPMPDVICAVCGQSPREDEETDTLEGDTIHTNPDQCIAARDRMWDARLAELIAQHDRRVSELLAANNVEVEKRRGFEAEANQEYAEKLLLRAECMRQRDRAELLAGFIQELPIETGIPEKVLAAIEATFPPAGEVRHGD